ncbi:MAG: acyl-CoA dehydrogenase family protein [Actinomycetota bacterium]
MDFRFSDDQALFAETVRGILANECPPAAVRTAWDNDTGTIDGLWSTLAATGVVGKTAPEDQAGLGMGDVDLVRIMEELGWAACPEVVLEHTAVAVPLIAEGGTVAQRDRWLAPAAAGDARLSCSLGSDLVNGAAQADALVLRSGDEMHLVPVDAVDLTPQASVDETRRLATVAWEPSEETRMDADAAAIERAERRAAVAAAAQCVGIAQRLLDFTVEYVQERRQFGSPVGVNQAVKHHLADVGKAIEFARPMVYRAGWSLTAGAPDAAEASSMAKALASDAVDLACRSSLQCHGAIAYTVEYDLQLWLKRGWAMAAAWGTASHHRDLVGRSLGV